MNVIESVPPPTQWRTTSTQVIVAVYSLLFIVGICGTTSTMSIIHFIQKSTATYALNGRGSGVHRRGLDTAMYYIFALCVVDFIVLLTIPMTVIDLLLGFWMFGASLCKVYHVFGSCGKVLSTFLLVALSFDRFMAVCFPHKSSLRTRTTVFRTIWGLTAFALVLLMPVLYGADAKKYILTNSTTRNGIYILRIHKCVENMSPPLFITFTFYTFTLGYALPLTAILAFSVVMLTRLHRHRRRQLLQSTTSSIVRRSGIPVNRISFYTLSIAAFYFVCLTPYWTSNIYSVFLELTGEQHQLNQLDDEFVLTMFFVHALTYLNSAANWVLYGLLNSQLQQRTRVTDARDTLDRHPHHNHRRPPSGGAATDSAVTDSPGPRGQYSTGSASHQPPPCRRSAPFGGQPVLVEGVVCEATAVESGDGNATDGSAGPCSSIKRRRRRKQRRGGEGGGQSTSAESQTVVLRSAAVDLCHDGGGKKRLCSCPQIAVERHQKQQTRFVDEPGDVDEPGIVDEPGGVDDQRQHASNGDDVGGRGGDHRCRRAASKDLSLVGASHRRGVNGGAGESMDKVGEPLLHSFDSSARVASV